MPKTRLEPNGNDTLNVEQTAAMLGVGTGVVYRLAKSGNIPAIRIGDVWRFSRSGLEEWIRTEATKNVK
jgi:excisionase family DNA binding protein